MHTDLEGHPNGRPSVFIGVHPWLELERPVCGACGMLMSKAMRLSAHFVRKRTTDGHGCTRILRGVLMEDHPCSSVVGT